MNSELKLLNLTEVEEKVYLQIVAFSQLSIEELAIYTGLGFENLDKIINELINKKYINRIESLNRYVCKFPFIETAREFSEIMDDLKVLSEGLSKFIDEQKIKILQEEEERKLKVNDDVSIKIKESDELNNQFSEKYGSIYNSTTIDIKNENENFDKSLK
jgi:sugar-specific transcriptional regulator TrmB